MQYSNNFAEMSTVGGLTESPAKTSKEAFSHHGDQMSEFVITARNRSFSQETDLQTVNDVDKFL